MEIRIKIHKSMNWNVAKTLYSHIKSLCNLVQGDSELLKVEFNDDYNKFGTKIPNMEFKQKD